MEEILIAITKFTGFGYWNVLTNLPWRAYRFLQIYSPTLILLAVAGIVLGWKKEAFRKRGEVFILSFLIFHLVTLAGFSSGSKRYALFLVPLTAFWAGKGLSEIWQRLQTYGEGSKKFLYPFLVLLILGSQLPEVLKPIRSYKEEQKIVGLWLRDHSPKGSSVAGLNPQEAFYAERKWIVIPKKKKTYGEVLRFLKENQADYLVTDEAMTKIVPHFFESIDRSDLNEIYKIQEREKVKVIIFKIQY